MYLIGRSIYKPLILKEYCYLHCYALLYMRARAPNDRIAKCRATILTQLNIPVTFFVTLVTIFVSRVTIFVTFVIIPHAREYYIGTLFIVS